MLFSLILLFFKNSFIWSIGYKILYFHVAQSAGYEEHTDNISAEG